MLFTISIVSHGHSDSVRDILKDISAYQGPDSLEIYLTWNAPLLETISEQTLQDISSWPLRIIKNVRAAGFSANHNTALRDAGPGIWCVVNPDIRLPVCTFGQLKLTMVDTSVGLAYPVQTTPSGRVLDYKRELVTPWSLLKKYLLKQIKKPVLQPSWVSGCFMAFPSQVYQLLEGFDRKYFLYCEDVDICLRLQLNKYSMQESNFSIVHDTRRDTLKNFNHFKWHAISLLKLWCSISFWDYYLMSRKVDRNSAL
jgi:N-acetylglucosaminyl-diphospho-decaprenol L-rhamnosyltransferase